MVKEEIEIFGDLNLYFDGLRMVNIKRRTKVKPTRGTKYIYLFDLEYDDEIIGTNILLHGNYSNTINHFFARLVGKRLTRRK